MNAKDDGVRKWRSELRRVGVNLDNPHSVWLSCRTCGQQWSPNLLPGGTLPDGYEVCPWNRCNEQLVEAANS